MMLPIHALKNKTRLEHSKKSAETLAQAIKQSSNQAIKQSSNQAIKQSSNQAIKQSSSMCF
jgi:F0F1-type ATP synthase membrane subunit b/b'